MRANYFQTLWQIVFLSIIKRLKIDFEKENDKNMRQTTDPNQSKYIIGALLSSIRKWLY